MLITVPYRIANPSSVSERVYAALAVKGSFFCVWASLCHRRLTAAKQSLRFRSPLLTISPTHTHWSVPLTSTCLEFAVGCMPGWLCSGALWECGGGWTTLKSGFNHQAESGAFGGEDDWEIWRLDPNVGVEWRTQCNIYIYTKFLYFFKMFFFTFLSFNIDMYIIMCVLLLLLCYIYARYLFDFEQYTF